MEHVPILYKQVDGMIMPTLLESFSATYIDSMALGVPIFTSDRDFARDVCGDAAWYFDPLNAESIFEVISNAFQSGQILTFTILMIPLFLLQNFVFNTEEPLIDIRSILKLAVIGFLFYARFQILLV